MEGQQGALTSWSFLWTFDFFILVVVRKMERQQTSFAGKFSFLKQIYINYEDIFKMATCLVVISYFLQDTFLLICLLWSLQNQKRSSPGMLIKINNFSDDNWTWVKLSDDQIY